MMLPTERLDARFSDAAAQPVPWADALAHLSRAQVAWVVTVRPDGRPHATPMVPVVHDGKAYFHTGRHEVKAANLAANPHALVLAGDTVWEHGLDVMVDGVATPVTDRDLLRALDGLYRERWDGRWSLDVDDDDGGVRSDAASDDIIVFEVTPSTVRAHSKGDPFGQTTYRFENRSQEGSR